VLLSWVFFCFLMFRVCASFSVLFFLKFVCLIKIGYLGLMARSVRSGVAFQPAYCMVSLKYLTAASIFSSVLSGTFRDSFTLTKFWKTSQFVYMLLKYGCFSWFCTCAVSLMIWLLWNFGRYLLWRRSQLGLVACCSRTASMIHAWDVTDIWYSPFLICTCQCMKWIFAFKIAVEHNVVPYRFEGFHLIVVHVVPL
jgi:hypothetical protein